MPQDCVLGCRSKLTDRRAYYTMLTKTGVRHVVYVASSPVFALVQYFRLLRTYVSSPVADLDGKIIQIGHRLTKTQLDLHKLLINYRKEKRRSMFH